MIDRYNHCVIKGSFKSAPKNLRILNIVFEQLISSIGDKIEVGPVCSENSEEKTMVSSIITSKGYANIFVINKEIPSSFLLEIFTPNQMDSFSLMKQLNDWFGLINGIECKIVKK